MEIVWDRKAVLFLDRRSTTPPARCRRKGLLPRGTDGGGDAWSKELFRVDRGGVEEIDDERCLLLARLGGGRYIYIVVREGQGSVDEPFLTTALLIFQCSGPAQFLPELLSK